MRARRGLFLGCDIGGTAARFAVIDEAGRLVRRGAAPGASALLATPGDRARLEASFARIGASLPHPVHAAAIGLSGYGPEAFTELAGMIAKETGIAPECLTLLDDVALAYRVLFQPGEGHLVAAGTGVIGTHFSADGSRLRIGGRGLLLDDAGSGGWIALTALRALYRRLDEDGIYGDMAGLATCLFDAIGSDDWAAVKHLIYGGDRGRIASLSLAIAKAAEAGDRFSQELLEEAGRELARLGNVLIARAGSRPLAFIGGVLKLSPVISETIADNLSGSACFPHIDVAEGAARLALEGIQRQSE
ncbi:N-acetylglucosamine kinase [Martelella radicis]|uniref:N-acetylglucosamine kinase-like BadF-type ATPase n=1 Tax=Martelella radicis TaxID=1397476 RepID=A0A7W6PAF1_9HYPH|nr:BadF/BadG/BcrA/BcrD ATPase family protein [Martelella radicis]MBB4122800.1 N-acetylglucosamine kinase-like BadF-type ATPase [Martelella radicis]